MNSTSFISALKLLIPFSVLIWLAGCEIPYKALNPDYSGQVGQVTDIEGNVYKTVGIGSQFWMAENLKTTRFNDSMKIPMILGDSLWATSRVPGFCYYNNDSVANRRTFGPLYNYYVVQTGRICPTGWHVPEDSEWNTLVQFLGGELMAGAKLKDYSTTLWDGPNPCIANNYGFAALPGGNRHVVGLKTYFQGIGEAGYWWTNTQKSDFQAYLRSLYSSDKSVGGGDYRKLYGCSVRCIKD